ncbi:hypothetical protein M3Y99_01005100 [Aphelenchoides fujianensis]|nr:hypothetical protein M3Y99_01005100 [Aphelenchoides fujianensis]
MSWTSIRWNRPSASGPSTGPTPVGGTVSARATRFQTTTSGGGHATASPSTAPSTSAAAEPKRALSTVGGIRARFGDSGRTTNAMVFTNKVAQPTTSKPSAGASAGVHSAIDRPIRGTTSRKF